MARCEKANTPNKSVVLNKKEADKLSAFQLIKQNSVLPKMINSNISWAAQGIRYFRTKNFNKYQF